MVASPVLARGPRESEGLAEEPDRSHERFERLSDASSLLVRFGSLRTVAVELAVETPNSIEETA
jgi:hypothetical protein